MIFKITKPETWVEATKYRYMDEMASFIGGYIDDVKMRFVNENFEVGSNLVQREGDALHVWDKTEDIWKRWSFCPLMVEEIQSGDAFDNVSSAIEEYMSNLSLCAHCGEYVPEVTMDGWCTECDSERSECPHCEERFLTNQMVWVGAEDAYMCTECRDEMYNYCNECGEYVTADEFDFDSDCCDRCKSRKVIRSYDYRPSTLHFQRSENETEKELYFGMEIEIDGAGEDGSYATKFKEIMGEAVYFKHDGSLDNGFEIVTHPMHFKAIEERKEDFKAMFDKAVSYGYKSHDTSTCGLHVHMSSHYFKEEDRVKLVYIVEKFWDKFVTFSRRKVSNLDRWAKRYGSEEVESIEGMDIKTNAKRKLHDYKAHDRYMAINLTNESTIEMRMFRGTLNIDTFMATIQMCYHLAKLVTKNDIDVLRTMTWEQIAENEYSELTAYLNKKGL